MAHGRQIRAVTAGGHAQRQRNGGQWRKDLRGTGRLRGAVLDNLARRTGEIAIGRRRRLNFASGKPLAVARRRRLAMPVEHSDPQKVHLQNHQQVSSESAPKVASQSAWHGTLFYWKSGKRGAKSIPPQPTRPRGALPNESCLSRLVFIFTTPRRTVYLVL